MHHRKSSLVVASLATVSLLVGGCGLFPLPQPTDKFEGAVAAAQVKAKEWDANARLIGITAVWVDEDGALDEEFDRPGWGFQFVNAAGTKQVGVTIDGDGGMILSDPIDLPTPVTGSLSHHTAQDIDDYIDVALAHLETIPAEKQLLTETLDIVVIVGFNQEDGSEDAVVLFHEEADQASDWSNFDWAKLFQTADAYVFLDTRTNTVETDSWEMSLARALRLATAAVEDGSRLVGIMGVWIDENGKLHEPTDKPGWGFQFVNAAGTQRVGVTVEADGNTIVSAATTMNPPVLQTLSDHATQDFVEYVAAAKAKLLEAPASELPQTGTHDLVVIVGFSMQDGSEEAVVLFHDEADQATNWATIDWFKLFQDAETYVFIDTATNTVENISWD